MEGDIEKMFHHIRLTDEDKDVHRFFWFDNNDLTKPPTVYRMKVHIFGAVSSPCIANFALRKCAEAIVSSECKSATESSFYMDDMMISCPNDDSALETVKEIQDALSRGGFILTSYASSSKELLAKLLSHDKITKKLKEVNIDHEALLNERTFGIQWNPENDTIGYAVNIPEQPKTKRGVRSTIQSVYDPLFLDSPGLVAAKRVFQICCDRKLDWDAPLPQDLGSWWNKWKEEIVMLNNYDIPRGFKTNIGIERTVDTQIHIFADGSNTAYGAVGYIRQVTDNHNTIVNIVMAKSRLTPLNRSSLKTTPRIELNAAKLALSLEEKLKSEIANQLSLTRQCFGRIIKQC